MFKLFFKNLLNIFTFFLLLSITILVFKSWFSFLPLSSGDWSYNFNSAIKNFPRFPYDWSFNFHSGLGGTSSFILALSSYFLFTSSFFFNILNIPWVLIERLVWFWPFLLISVFFSYFLFKKLFSEMFALVSSFIYLFNTYILMIVGGGQMGVALAYAIVPLVLYFFIKTIDFLNSSINNFQFSFSKLQLPLLLGLSLSILVFFDIRLAYICMTAVTLYLILSIKYKISKNNFLEIFNLIFYSLIIPGMIVFLLNSFWIISLIAGGKNPLVEFGTVYSSLESVKYFSFAKFENSFGLLHPNWPENIFGKVGFMKPEFLLLPILAFSSLFFVSKTKDQKSKIYILYFALLGLIGAFWAKGANEPFGGIYLWLFDNFPGFMMFRDPTKWYILVAISYSILIPYTVWKIYEFLKSQVQFSILNFQFSIKNKIFNLQNIFLFFLIFYFLYLIRPAISGQLTGTFRATTVPSDYIKLERFLSSQKGFSRTLWVPTQQRFGFYSNLHPAIPAQDFYKTVDYSQIIKKIESTEGLLQESAVKYVIVPYDSQGEIFLKDRKYDNSIYQKTINDIKQITYLKQVSCFGKIAVFEVPSTKDHFYFSNQKSATSNQQITYKYISPVEYEVSVKNAKVGDTIVFSESYDARWIARDKNTKFYDWPNLISSNPHERAFNSFTLRKSGDYTLTIYYYPQILVNIGMVISVMTLMFILWTLIYLKKKKL